MLISKTPYRISLAGGGSDFPGWYNEYGGMVVSVTINKYCYTTIRELPKFFPNIKNRIVYGKIELTKDISSIEHPVVRALLRENNTELGYEIHHFGDLPARSGIGSSSAFTVGLINALAYMNGMEISKHELAQKAIHLEQVVLKESVGSQDQVASAFGGLNKIIFSKSGFNVEPVKIEKSRLQLLEESLVLVYTGLARTASEIEQEKISRMIANEVRFDDAVKQAHEVDKILVDGSRNILDIGDILNDGWQKKKNLSSAVSSSEIDNIYDNGLRSGAIGGKLIGAGGGGFFIFCVEGSREQFMDKMNDYICIPIEFDFDGSTVFELEKVKETNK
jgi:D-glycero-alpha-D-manno-heptose-7-phosphate kinase